MNIQYKRTAVVKNARNPYFNYHEHRCPGFNNLYVKIPLCFPFLLILLISHSCFAKQTNILR